MSYKKLRYAYALANSIRADQHSETGEQDTNMTVVNKGHQLILKACHLHSSIDFKTEFRMVSLGFHLATCSNFKPLSDVLRMMGTTASVETYESTTTHFVTQEVHRRCQSQIVGV